ncbi:MAG: DUF123 domain-containing protein, partial [Chloroflexi bacterium]|nr:DUF123 domain-containing protein [Chloroflexota bacterium]
RVELVGVWVFPGERRLECKLASILVCLYDASVPAPGFGSSDCRCPAHLIGLPRRLPPQPLAGAADQSLSEQGVIGLIGQRFASSSLSFHFEGDH